jgi:hypothetical protein
MCSGSIYCQTKLHKTNFTQLTPAVPCSSELMTPFFTCLLLLLLLSANSNAPSAHARSVRQETLLPGMYIVLNRPSRDADTLMTRLSFVSHLIPESLLLAVQTNGPREVANH